MRSAAWLTAFVNAIVFASLIIYFTVVFLNATFTHEFLTVSDVPYYDDVTGGWRNAFANRYHFEFWIFASDLLRFIIPLAYATVIPQLIVDPDGLWTILPNLFYVILFIIEVLKAIWRGWQWGFCADFQFCRNFDESKCMQKFDCPANFLWLWVFWYNIAFIVILIIYLFLITLYERGAKEYYTYREMYGISEDQLIQKDKGVSTAMPAAMFRQYLKTYDKKVF